MSADRKHQHPEPVTSPRTHHGSSLFAIAAFTVIGLAIWFRFGAWVLLKAFGGVL